MWNDILFLEQLKSYESWYAFGIFSTSARFHLTNLSVAFGGARSRFRQFPDPCRALLPVGMRMRMRPHVHAIKKHVRSMVYRSFPIASKVKRDWFYLVLPPLRHVALPARNFRFCLRRFFFRVAYFVRPFRVDMRTFASRN